jgi:hypothetical protein
MAALVVRELPGLHARSIPSRGNRSFEGTLARQTSKISGFPEQESLRRSPNVPRSAPQCRHLIKVEAGVFLAVKADPQAVANVADDLKLRDLV